MPFLFRVRLSAFVFAVPHRTLLIAERFYTRVTEQLSFAERRVMIKKKSLKPLLDLSLHPACSLVSFRTLFVFSFTFASTRRFGYSYSFSSPSALIIFSFTPHALVASAITTTVRFGLPTPFPIFFCSYFSRLADYTVFQTRTHRAADENRLKHVRTSFVAIGRAILYT